MNSQTSGVFAQIRSIAAGDRFDAYVKRADGPMIVLASLFLVVWSVDSLVADLPPVLQWVLYVTQGFIWLIFLVDLVIRVLISPDSWRYIVRHPLDVLSVLVPQLRPLRLLAIFTSGTRLMTAKGALATGQIVVLSVVLLTWVSAVAVFNAEMGVPGSDIVTFGDALWWAVVTMTTVGYGDFTPVSAAGRAIAVVLMVVGIALLGVITASVASWFVTLTNSRNDSDHQEEDAQRDREIVEMRQEIASLHSKLDALLKESKTRRKKD